VIVAGVDLDHDRAEKQPHPTRAQAVIPIAASSLVYRAHPVADAYAAKLIEAEKLLARDDGDFPGSLTLAFEKAADLAYGETPHQQAAYYAERGARMHLLSHHPAHGKPPPSTT
jgi:AICAR transformylase/IMP cyclohydrolase PurH